MGHYPYSSATRTKDIDRISDSALSQGFQGDIIALILISLESRIDRFPFPCLPNGKNDFKTIPITIQNDSPACRDREEAILPG